MIKKILLLLFICFSYTLFAQPANDNCSNAIPFTNINGGCEFFNSAMSTFDLANGDCVPGADDINGWFSFVAQGEDVDITVNGQTNNVYVTLVSFDPTPCDFASANQIACGFGSNGATAISIDDALTIGQTYYIIVNIGDNVEAMASVCVTNPIPVVGPPNDEACNEQTVQDNCVMTSGTTEAATLDFTGVPGGCGPNAEVGVFYDFTLSVGNNAVEIDVTNLSSNGDVTVILGQWATSCLGNLSVLEVYCGADGSNLIEFGGLVAGNSYVVYVATSEADAGSFSLSVCGTGPPPGCSLNDVCNQAEIINGVVSDSPFLCVDGCNIGASPEPGLGGCNMASEEVVWFQFTTDANASLASYYVDGTMVAPTLQVFSGNCNGLIIESNCITGANGYIELLNEDVGPNTTYYIAVSNSFGDGGEFDLCIQTLNNPSSCALESDIYVQGTSFGSPLDGPYQPGETVQFCLTVQQYTPVGNNCQWFQGIIPVFGNGWDDSSFAPNGMPNTITQNIMPFANATWGWYTDVTYNNQVFTKSIGDFDGDGDIEMCHYTEPNCPNNGIEAGQIVPPGWFCWTPNGGTNGHPNVDWGDGDDCGTIDGPWVVCFQLTAKPYPECDADESSSDTTVKMYTTSDGETGDWVGGPSICANDIPAIYPSNINCCIGPELLPVMETICSGGTSSMQLFSDQDPGVTYTWTAIPNGSINGATDGTGAFITQTLENTTTVSQTQSYEVIPVSESGCFGLPQIVNIIVLPAILVDAGDVIDGCAQGVFNLGGSPTATGGDGNFTYNWGNAAIQNVANPTASPNIPTTYVVTVTDGNGCTSTDDVFLDIKPRFDVDIMGNLELCSDDPTTFLTSTPQGGTPSYSYEWSGPGANGNDNPAILYDGNGLPSGTHTITVVVTDDNGCTGDEEIDVIINKVPDIYFTTFPISASFCPGNTVGIIADAIGSPGAVMTFDWSTPEGPKNGSFITVGTEGYYVLNVYDEFGCASKDSIFVDEVPPPQPELIAPMGVCPGSQIQITLDSTWTAYNWSTGSDSSSTMASAGTYSVTVTNSGGCTGVDVITINPLNAPNASIGGSSTFCDGSSTILSTSSGFASYVWSDENNIIISDADTAFVNTPGNYNVLVVDSNGCIATDTILVEVQDFLVPNVLGDTSICPGFCTELNAGSGYVNYMWETGEDTQIIDVCDVGTYTVTVFDAGGCTGEQTRIVTENDLPIPMITSDSGTNSFCPGDELVLDAGAGFSSYSWIGGTNDQTLVVDTAGTYFVTVVDDETCTAIATIDVIINEEPAPSFTGITSFCPGGSTFLTPEDGYVSYEIDVDNNGSIDIVNTTPDPFEISQIGNAKLIVTDTNGCEGEILIPINLFNAPQPQTSIDTASYCIGGSVSISLTTNFTSVEWFNESGTTVGLGQSIIVDSPGIYDVVVTDDNGCNGSSSMVVIESTELSPSITGPLKTCDNTPVVLDAGAGYDDYDWGVYGDTQTITVSDAGMYTVSVFDNSGCSGEATFTLTNAATPTATVVGTAFICNNNNDVNIPILDIDQLVTGADGFWTDLDGTGVNLSNINAVDFTGVAAGFYSFTYTTTTAIAPCQNQMYTTIIEVSECLCPSVETKGSEPLCIENGMILLDTLQITTEPGSWSVISGPGGNPITGNVFNATNGMEGDYVIRFTLDDPKDGCDNFSEQTITVISPNSPGMFVGAAQFCEGETANINLSDLLEGEDLGGIWEEISIVPSGPNAFDDAVGIFTIDNEVVGTYQFVYTVPASGPCGEKSTVVDVLILENPISDAGPDAMIDCDMATVQLGGTSVGNNLSFNWSELKGVIITNPNAENISVTEEGVYVLEVTNINQCVDIDTATVTENTNFPTLDLVGEGPICQGEQNGIINMNAVGGEGPYEYSLDAINWVSNEGFLDLGPGTYTVYVRDQHGCIDDEIIILNDADEFIADLGNDLFLVNVNDTTVYLNFPQGNTAIQTAIWTVNGSIVCEGDSCLTYNFVGPNDATVCVEVISEEGCFGSDCIEIRNSRTQNAYIANVFSPNQDGNNDNVFVQGGDNLVNVNFFRIYNRWGELVFDNEDFLPNNPAEGWNGSFKDTQVNPGVFAFLVEVEFEDGSVELISGDITVVK